MKNTLNKQHYVYPFIFLAIAVYIMFKKPNEYMAFTLAILGIIMTLVNILLRVLFKKQIDKED